VIDYVHSRGSSEFGLSAVAWIIDGHRLERVRAVSANIDHPPHCGGDTTYEAIKVIENWRLGFCLGNAVKYICRAGKKDGARTLEDLEKAVWCLSREVERLKTEKKA